MITLDMENVTVMKRNGKFLLYDPTQPTWFKISPLAALVVLFLQEEEYTIPFIAELLGTSQEYAEKIVTEFIENVEEKTKNAAYRSKKGLDIEINVADSCSLECKYCYFLYNSQRVLTTEEWMEIVDSAAHLHPERIIFSGGEPLCREDLFEIGKYAKHLHLKTHLLSNGIIPKSTLPSIARYFDSVQISIDGFPATQKFLRGASFEVVTATMKELVRLGVPLKAGITLTSVNIYEAVPLIQWLSEMGVDMFHISLFKEVGKGKNYPHFKPNPDAVVRLFLEMLRLDLNVDTLFHLMPRRSEKKKYCGAGKEIVSVMPDGDVYPCDALISKEFFCGSALHEDLSDIYVNSSTLNRVRKVTVEDSSICGSCDFRYLCGGGCIAESFFKKGKADVPGPDCEFLKRFYEEIIWIA